MNLDDIDPNEFFRTNDMSLATYLKIDGHSPQHVGWHSGTCYWLFRVSDELLDATEAFVAGEARVCPKDFSQRYGQTKREFYDSQPQAAVGG